MAKIQNPLFSISASGSVGRIVFRNTDTAQTARFKTFRHAPQPSAAQITARANTTAAAAAWAALQVSDRDEWASRGLILRYESDRENATVLHHGWALWLREWHLQQASALRLPMLPT